MLSKCLYRHVKSGNLDLYVSMIFRNTKWKFLEGVNVSGAPPPRQVVVQQCIRDMGILEVLCNYVSCFIPMETCGPWF